MQLPALTEKALVTTLLIAFLLLHIFAVAVLQRAHAGDGALEQDLSSKLYD
jgi:cell division protein FtsL